MHAGDRLVGFLIALVGLALLYRIGAPAAASDTTSNWSAVEPWLGLLLILGGLGVAAHAEWRR